MSDKKPASPYRAIIEHMIKNDERCGSPSCPLTMMGHLITGLSPELMDMVKEVDPSQLTRGEMAQHESEQGLIPNPLRAPVPRDAVARQAMIVGVEPPRDACARIIKDHSEETR